ncbi:MAG: hypothetical protein R2788_21470 [Saprospiraceae bacterium]
MHAKAPAINFVEFFVRDIPQEMDVLLKIRTVVSIFHLPCLPSEAPCDQELLRMNG